MNTLGLTFHTLSRSIGQKLFLALRPSNIIERLPKVQQYSGTNKSTCAISPQMIFHVRFISRVCTVHCALCVLNLDRFGTRRRHRKRHNSRPDEFHTHTIILRCASSLYHINNSINLKSFVSVSPPLYSSLYIYFLLLLRACDDC